MRGRKPKPTVLKDLHGSEEPRNPLEPIPVGAISDDPTECPAHFNADQRDAWEYAVRHSPPGMLKRIDSMVLEAWVVSHCLHRRATEEMGRSELLTRTPNDCPVQNPLIAIVNRQALIMSKLASDLGFTPVSRPRILVSGASGGESLAARPSSLRRRMHRSRASKTTSQTPPRSIETPTTEIRK